MARLGANVSSFAVQHVSSVRGGASLAISLQTWVPVGLSAKVLDVRVQDWLDEKHSERRSLEDRGEEEDE